MALSKVDPRLLERRSGAIDVLALSTYWAAIPGLRFWSGGWVKSRDLRKWLSERPKICFAGSRLKEEINHLRHKVA